MSEYLIYFVIWIIGFAISVALSFNFNRLSKKNFLDKGYQSPYLNFSLNSAIWIGFFSWISIAFQLIFLSSESKIISNLFEACSNTWDKASCRFELKKDC